MSVFVHSLWAESPGPYEFVRDYIRTYFEATRAFEGSGYFMLTRTEQAEGDPGDAWIRPESTAASHQVAVYVLDPSRSRHPVGGTVIGAASYLPALNSDIMDELNESVPPVRPLLPHLDRDRVADLSVYEARIVTEDIERSITYADRDRAGSRFREDWSSETSLTAATLRYEPLGVLVTAFSDGQIWLEGTDPETIPEVVAGTVSRLWFGG
jgi:hypothetical protein